MKLIESAAQEESRERHSALRPVHFGIFSAVEELLALFWDSFEVFRFEFVQAQ